MRLAPTVLLALLLAPCAVAQGVPWVGPFDDDRLEDARLGGVPVASPRVAAAGEAEWSDRFGGPPGVEGAALAAAEWGGDLYVGGSFRSAGGGRTVAGALARWDGAAWHDVEGGLFDPPSCPYSNCGSVYALAATDGALVVGGRFGPAQGGPGGFPFETIAAWDGAAWRGLGPGLRWEDPSTDGSTVRGGWVEAMVDTDEGLVAAGWFNRAGDAPVSNVARWDGEAWGDLGGGLPFWVEALAADGDRLVAVGYRDLDTYFGAAVAEWNGEAWVVGYLEAPFRDSPGRVDAAAFVDGDLVVGGLFDAIDGVPAQSVARWDGAAWHPLGAGVDSNVWDLAVTPAGDLVAGGLFRTAGGEPVGRIAAWDGAAWRGLGDGVRGREELSFRGRVSRVAMTEAGLVAAGRFETAGGAMAANVAVWRAGTWRAVGEPAGAGLSGRAYAALNTPDGVVVGGYFERAGSLRANGVARWDGASWHALGDGLEGVPRGFATDGARIVAVGADLLGDAAAAEWDGTAWSPLTGSAVQLFHGWSAAYHQGHLYVAGTFWDPVTETAPVLMRWSGTDWEPPPGGAADTFPPGTLQTVGDRLVLHGTFDTVGGVSTGPLAAWDGTAWSSFGAPLAGSVGQMVMGPGGPVVAGRVGVDPGETPLQVLRWDGTEWQPVGGDLETPYFSGGLSSLAVVGEEAFVAGRFPEYQSLLGVPLDGGGGPTPVAGAPDLTNGALLGLDDALVVLGSFARAGGLPSANIAVLGPPSAAAVRPEAAALALRIAPNPVGRGRAAAVTLHLPAPTRVRVAVVDLLGREVRVLADEAVPEGPSRFALDVAGLAPGLYVVAAQAGADRATARLVVGGGRVGR